MMNRHLYSSGALLSGSLLAVAIFLNSELALFTSPAWSSLIAHFVGIFGSWGLWKYLSTEKKWFPFSPKAPRWSYFGGVFGAMIVVLSNMTVNSSIGLVGTVSLMILGQTCFAILFDLWGWFGMEKRELHRADFLRVAFILAGSLLIIIY